MLIGWCWQWATSSPWETSNISSLREWFANVTPPLPLTLTVPAETLSCGSGDFAATPPPWLGAGSPVPTLSRYWRTDQRDKPAIDIKNVNQTINRSSLTLSLLVGDGRGTLRKSSRRTNKKM